MSSEKFEGHKQSKEILTSAVYVDCKLNIEPSRRGNPVQARSAQVLLQDENTPISEYKVGFKKPPLHSQFKEGQSGNLKGRPKGSKNKPKIKAAPKPRVEKSSSKASCPKITQYDPIFPNLEHCTFDDVKQKVKIFGPMTIAEQQEWLAIEKRVSNLRNDIIWFWEEINQCKDEYLKEQFLENVHHTHSLIADDLKRKQKFIRSMSYAEFENFRKQQKKSCFARPKHMS